MTTLARVRSTTRRAVVAAAALGLSLASAASAQDIRFLRIGTGSISGVYFPVGGLIASAISNPPGSRACDEGGSCGVPGLIAVAQATLGSVANVRAIGAGTLESALAQADVAYFAEAGKGIFAGKNRVASLRALASLYPEAVHIVVRKNSPIKSIADLVGRRVSLDLSGSGTRAVANLVLEAYNVDPKSLRQVNSQVGPAVDRIRARSIDAFFFVGGFPVGSIARLARETPLRLLTVSGAHADAIRQHDPFLSAATIPDQTYRGVPAVATVAVYALWVASTALDDDTAYGMVRALWHPSTRRLLDHGHLAARQARLENALKGIALPLHPGAERYYRERGLIKAEQPKAGAAPQSVPASPLAAPPAEKPAAAPGAPTPPAPPSN